MMFLLVDQDEDDFSTLLGPRLLSPPKASWFEVKKELVRFHGLMGADMR